MYWHTASATGTRMLMLDAQDTPEPCRRKLTPFPTAQSNGRGNWTADLALLRPGVCCRRGGGLKSSPQDFWAPQGRPSLAGIAGTPGSPTPGGLANVVEGPPRPVRHDESGYRLRAAELQGRNRFGIAMKAHIASDKPDECDLHEVRLAALARTPEFGLDGPWCSGICRYADRPRNRRACGLGREAD
jgi:hypothetical protein